MSGSGIWRTSDCFREARIARGLPPEHRIVDARPHDGHVDYLIEGPSLPPTDPPMLVRPIYRLDDRLNDIDHVVRMTGHWEHAPDFVWQVGEWPSDAAFIAEMRRPDRVRLRRAASFASPDRY